jgi:SAM-dependent methyltransferase
MCEVEWYDTHHAQEHNYDVYIPSWAYVVSRISSHETIADFGCGPGEFAKFAINNGLRYKYGIDFSIEAIKRARQLLPKHAKRFKVADLYNQKTYTALKHYNVAVFLEVLEHIKKDLDILRFLPRKKRIIISLPCRPHPSHYRYFGSIKECINRYSPIVKIIGSTEVTIKSKSKIYILDGVIK